MKDYGDGVQGIWDYDVDPMYVMVNGDRAVLIDTGMAGRPVWRFEGHPA
ncbi:MAG: hypothetical protein ACLS8R_07130 [Anaeromassilibacillus sp.]